MNWLESEKNELNTSSFQYPNEKNKQFKPLSGQFLIGIWNLSRFLVTLSRFISK